ncbi:MerR family transcriptional regulator [Paenibacillus herberti]|uniref:HTH merR-type domain-containing protein n=1 Tax=Paenibacillus herberti TaxID=1619309 RepID=A0A229NVV5_9BACL|nr:MerR family transcriptional regulator [Paenibacillus herberti]OXM13998.1 hypothetical protein CGZ75_13420 [Paenibacillus herberti]
MPDNSSRYITISQLAKISGVTKHALLHYDDIGLLKPEFINASGYRYYSYRQSYILDIISVLKKAGSSLQEIKSFIQNRNAINLIELFKQKQQELEMEQLRIGRMQNILRNAIQMTEKSMEAFREVPFLEECEEEYLIATPLEQGTEEEFNAKLSEHRSYCEEHFIYHEFPIWAAYSKASLESGIFFWGYIANKLQEPISGERMITKPKGLYAVMDYKGSYESTPEAYFILKEYIERNGMKIIGDVYVVDMLTYFSEIDPDSFVVRVFIEVSV